MALSDNDIELIQKYLGEAISDKDKLVFDSRLNDLEFKDELLLQSKMLDALAHHDTQEVTDFLQSEDAPTPIPGKRKWGLFVIGLFVGMLITHFLIQYLTESKTTDVQSEPIALVEKYNQAFPAEVIGRGDNLNENDQLKAAFAAYSSGKYQSALEQFNALNLKTEKIDMYKANCLLQLDNYTEALKLFSAIEKSTDKNIADNANWYSALSQMGLGQNNKAKQKIKDIASDGNHMFNKQAKSLLQESLFK